MNALRASREEAFPAQLARGLRGRYAAQLEPLSDGELLEIVREGLRAAEAYSIRSDAGRASYVELLFAASPDFDSHPRIRRVLTQEGADAKAPLLPSLIPEPVWVEASRPLDAGQMLQWARRRRGL